MVTSDEPEITYTQLLQDNDNDDDNTNILFEANLVRNGEAVTILVTDTNGRVTLIVTKNAIPVKAVTVTVTAAAIKARAEVQEYLKNHWVYNEESDDDSFFN